MDEENIIIEGQNSGKLYFRTSFLLIHTIIQQSGVEFILFHLYCISIEFIVFDLKYLIRE